MILMSMIKNYFIIRNGRVFYSVDFNFIIEN
jgi:hypothetical protein